MNYLQISLTSKCNRSCWHCPMAQYRNTDDEKYHLTNSVLIPWLKKNIDPSKWLVELTGGEPTLYHGLGQLLDWLDENKYLVHVRTNGIITIAPRFNVKRIVAFHDLDNPPKAFDIVLIVDKIDSEKKIAYCKEHNIPFKVIGKDKENPDGAMHGFKYIAYIEPTCHTTRCPACQPTPRIEDGIDVTRMEYEEFSVSECCKHCKAAIDAWRFL